MKKLFIHASEWHLFKTLAVKANQLFQYQWNKQESKAEVLISTDFCSQYGY